MAKALKTTKSQAVSKGKPEASKALVPASKPTAIEATAPALSKKEASAAARREKEKSKRTLARLLRELDQHEQNRYFSLKERMYKKAKAYIGHPVRDYNNDAIKLEMAALGKELSQFGERLTTAAIAKKGGYFTEDQYLAEALKDGGLLTKLDKLRAEVFCKRNLGIAFDSYHHEPQEWSKE